MITLEQEWSILAQPPFKTDNHLFLVDNEVVGRFRMWATYNIYFDRGPEYLMVADFHIFAVYRGLGYGHLMMKALLDKAKNMSCRIVKLDVFRTNDIALRVYHKAGFVFETEWSELQVQRMVKIIEQ